MTDALTISLKYGLLRSPTLCMAWHANGRLSYHIMNVCVFRVGMGCLYAMRSNWRYSKADLIYAKFEMCHTTRCINLFLYSISIYTIATAGAYSFSQRVILMKSMCISVKVLHLTSDTAWTQDIIESWNTYVLLERVTYLFDTEMTSSPVSYFNNLIIPTKFQVH